MDRTQNPQSQRNPMNFGAIYAAGGISFHLLDSNSDQHPEKHHRRNILPQQTNQNCNYRNNNNNHRMFTNQNHRMYYHSQPKENHKRGPQRSQAHNSNPPNEPAPSTSASTSAGCFINGIKNIYNQFMHPQLRCDFYSDHHRFYNPKYRNNYTNSNSNQNCRNNKSQYSKKSQMNTNSQNTASNCSFTEKKNELRDAKDRTHEIVAIFTSEDFPELPAPKKKITNPSDVGKSYTLAGNNNNNLNNKTTRKNKYHNKKPQEDGDLLIDFVIFSSHSPDQSTCSKGNKNRTKIRQRQLSECSDDSFIICFDNNAAEGVIEFSDDSITDKSDSSEDETDSSEDEDETVIEKHKNSNIENNKTENYDSSDGTSQPDSGFDDCKDKKVRFNLKPEVHVMRTWDFAYRAARKGNWEACSRDRCRFKNRIERLSVILNPILDINHRENIFKTRFCDNQIKNL